MCDGCGGLVRVVEAFYTMLLHVSQKRQKVIHLGLDHVSRGLERREADREGSALVDVAPLVTVTL